MNRNLFFLLLAALLINDSVFTSTLKAQCIAALGYSQSSQPATKIEGEYVAKIKKYLPSGTIKDIQSFDDYFNKVRIGRTSQEEILHWFDRPATVQSTFGLEGFVFDYNFNSSPESHPLELDDSPHLSNSLRSAGRENSQSHYYVEYTFTMNAATKLVETKKKEFFSGFKGQGYKGYTGACLKPVIYFYPLKEQDVFVRLHYAGDITVSYPHYDALIKGWNIRAYPDGKIINTADQEEYSYIFWEGNPSDAHYDLSEGFIVEGQKSEEFLRKTLKKMGLKPREYNEFIVYWFPKLKSNKYNLIHFAHKEYENIAKLEITPSPDSILRVFMVYKPMTEKIEIKPQEIKSFNRTGFTVIEWGGTELTKM